jgi:16S rRNA (cytosine1402-N4)-methyltransferase
MRRGRGDGTTGAAPGGPVPHIPVLLRDVVDGLAIKRDGRYIDGTFGAGGYSKAILEAAPGVRVLAIDRDPDAIARGYALVDNFAGRLTLCEGRFSAMGKLAAAFGFAPCQGVTLDIGVSSMQIDEAERGFSFRFDGPLDMRMEQAGESAADLVNQMPEEKLANLIYLYGEERRSRAIARAIVAARREAPITRTKTLADLVSRVVRSAPDDIHPATRTFQALRIAVNDELGELERALDAAEALLAPGGRLAIVTFHSLEDRIVKRFLTERAGRAAAPSRHAPEETRDVATFALIGRKPVVADEDECRRNPRARSAKLRVAERTNAPARGNAS